MIKKLFFLLIILFSSTLLYGQFLYKIEPPSSLNDYRVISIGDKNFHPGWINSIIFMPDRGDFSIAYVSLNDKSIFKWNQGFYEGVCPVFNMDPISNLVNDDNMIICLDNGDGTIYWHNKPEELGMSYHDIKCRVTYKGVTKLIDIGDSYPISISYKTIQSSFQDNIQNKPFDIELFYDLPTHWYRHFSDAPKEMSSKLFKGIVFYSSADLTIDYTNPTCVDRDDASIIIKDIPLSKAKSLRLNIERMIAGKFDEGVRLDYNKINASTIVVNNKVIEEMTTSGMKLISGQYKVEAFINFGVGFVCPQKLEFTLKDPPPIKIKSLDIIKYTRPIAFGDETKYFSKSYKGDISGTIIISGREGVKFGSTWDLDFPPVKIRNLEYQYSFTHRLVWGSIIKVSDSYECSSDVKSIPTIWADRLRINTHSIHYTCDQRKGSLKYSIRGGFGPYKVELLQDGLLISEQRINNNPLSGIFLNLLVGSYKIKITDLATGLSRSVSTSKSFKIKQKIAPLVLNTDDKEEITGSGLANGEINLSASGGTLPYTFFIDDMEGSFKEGLSKGTHPCKVKDGNGCIDTDDVILIEPGELLLEFISKTPATCDAVKDGSVTYKLRGGRDEDVFQSLLYLGWRSATIKNRIFIHYRWFQTTVKNRIITATGLPSGDFRVYALNRADIKTPTENLTINNIPEADQFRIANIDTKLVSCLAGHNGEILFEVENGTVSSCSIHNYSGTNIGIGISTPQIFNNVSANTSKVNIANLESDFYTIILESNIGCSIEGNYCVGRDPNTLKLAQPVITLPTCISETNGKIVLQGKNGLASDGSSPSNYLYSIDEGNNYVSENEFSGLTSQKYSVYVQDDFGCLASKEVSLVSDVIPISFKLSTTPGSCESADNGIITITDLVYDPDLSLIYTLDGNEKSPISNSYTGLDVGMHTVGISYKDGCITEESVEVKNLNHSPSISQTTIEDLACESASNGAIDVDVSTTYPSTKLTYGLNDATNNIVAGELSDNTKFVGMTSQTYKFIATDENACSSSLDINVPVSENAVHFTKEEWVPATCIAAKNGIIRVEASGGIADTFGYIFSFNGIVKKGFSVEFTGLEVRTKGKVIVTDQLDCTSETAEKEVQVTKDLLEITAVDKTDPVCFGTNSGEIKPTVENEIGTLAYSIEKKNKDNVYFPIMSTYDVGSNAYKNLDFGVYKVIVNDEDACNTFYEGIELFNPEEAKVTDSNYNYIKIKGEKTGEYEITLVGINKSFTYELKNITSGEPGVVIESGNLFYDTGVEIVKKLGSLAAGNYKFSLTDDDSCLDFGGSETYTEEFTIQEPDFELAYIDEVITHVSCNGLSDGAISISGIGGWGNYSYSLNGSLWQKNGSFSNLIAGNYSIEIRDREETIITHVITITEPDVLSLAIDKTKDATCPVYANGRVFATSKNGIPFSEGLHYWIENTDDRSIVLGDSHSDNSYVFKELPKGNYEVFVSDSHSCSDSKTVSINEPDVATISLDYNYIKTKGNATGEISLNITGGNGLFDYECILNKEIETFQKGQMATGIALTNLFAGTYTFLVRDTAGCVYEDKEWMERIVEMRESDFALSFDIEEQRNVTCFGLTDGYLKLKGKGGWGDYRFQLNANPQKLSNEFSNLPVAVYQLQISDSVGNSSIKEISIIEPDLLTAEYLSHKEVTCFGGNDGEIILKIEGGNPEYNLSFNGIDWITGSAMTKLEKAGYDILVRDSKGCEVKVETIKIDQPDEIILLSSLLTKSRCSNNEGSIVTEFSGGVGQYTYQWTKDTLVDGTYVWKEIPNSNSATMERLFSSQYIVKVRDEHLCELNFDFALGDITDLTIESIHVEDVSCWGYKDGKASAFVKNGNSPYSYSWDVDITESNKDLAWDILAGTYHLLVRDNKGCAVSKKFTIGGPNPLSYQIDEIVHPLCYGGEKGFINLHAIGGTADYLYSWNDGRTGSSIKELNPNVYSLTIDDAHNCKSIFDFDMKYQRELTPFIGNDTLICHYSSLLLKSGGYEQSNWSSNNGFSSKKSNIEVTKPGTYYLQVKDEDKCQGYDTISLDVSYLKIDELKTRDVSCNSFADGNAEITVSPVDWKHVIGWPDGSNASTWNNLSGGDYRVQITDDYGCSDQREFSIYEPEELKIEVKNLFHPLCFGVPDGFIRLNPLGGNGDYQFTWDHGSNKNRLTKLDQGDYSVLLTDKKGCQLTDIFSLKYQKAIYPDLGEDITICSNNFVSLYPGVFAEYFWMKGNLILDNTESDLVVWDANEYSVEAKDEDGCTASDTININVIESELNPVLLSASSVAVGDTLMVMDVSQPQPESLTWEFTGAHKITEQTSFYCLVVFSEEGMYEMKMSALLNDCVGELRESILVVPASESAATGTETQSEAYVQLKKLIVSPNPSDGLFAADAELAESAEITFYLVNLQTGQVIEKRKRNGFKTYRETFSLSQSGSYCVYAESKGERKVVKLIVL